jgi:hypothetical protein
MPKLALFLACEKVIIDQNNNPSLITLLTDLTVNIRPGTTVEENAMFPMTWTVFSIWDQDNSADQGKTFEQRCVLTSPSGVDLITTPIWAFEFKTQRQRVINPINQMPVGPPGEYTVTTALREKGSTDWKEMGSLTLKIVHATPPTPPAIN